MAENNKDRLLSLQDCYSISDDIGRIFKPLDRNGEVAFTIKGATRQLGHPDVGPLQIDKSLQAFSVVSSRPGMSDHVYVKVEKGTDRGPFSQRKYNAALLFYALGASLDSATFLDDLDRDNLATGDAYHLLMLRRVAITRTVTLEPAMGIENALAWFSAILFARWFDQKNSSTFGQSITDYLHEYLSEEDGNPLECVLELAEANQTLIQRIAWRHQNSIELYFYELMTANGFGDKIIRFLCQTVSPEIQTGTPLPGHNLMHLLAYGFELSDMDAIPLSSRCVQRLKEQGDKILH